MKSTFSVFASAAAVITAAAIVIAAPALLMRPIASAQIAGYKNTGEVTSGGARASNEGDARARLAGAARQNKFFYDNLFWSFAGKPQRGWKIYAPLIGLTVASAAAADSADFARKVSQWQSARGLSATGILDRQTLETMIAVWQSQRLAKRTDSLATAAPQLISAPIADFFDPTRNSDLLEVESETYAAYKRMAAAARRELADADVRVVDARFFRIISAYRSPAYQAELRRREPRAGRGALAKFSTHATGQALDLYVGGEPATTKDANRQLQVETPAYRWLIKNAARFGFYPYFYEPWHWEFVPGR